MTKTDSAYSLRKNLILSLVILFVTLLFVGESKAANAVPKQATSSTEVNRVEARPRAFMTVEDLEIIRYLHIELKRVSGKVIRVQAFIKGYRYRFHKTSSSDNIWKSKRLLGGGYENRKATVVVWRKNKKKLRIKEVIAAGNVINPDPDPNPDPPVVIEPTIITSENISPAWSKDVTDYTTTCADPVGFNVDSKTEPVSIDNTTPTVGVFSKTVDLEPGQSTTVSVPSTGIDQTIRCLPADFPTPEVSGKGSGIFYLTAPTLAFGSGTSNYAVILDSNGTPVWWQDDPTGNIIDLKLIDSDTVAWGHSNGGGFFPGTLSNSYYLHNLDGSLEKTLTPVGFGSDHHEMQPTSDGGYLLLGYVPRNCPDVPSECVDLSAYGGPTQATVVDNIVQKIDADGNLVWNWNSRDHIDLSESSQWLNKIGSPALPDGRPAYDIIHTNSVEPTADGFVFSARHLNAVYRVTNPETTGDIAWKLGGTSTPESLSVLDDPYSPNPLAGQHDARMLPNGNLTVHENGTDMSRPPRAAEYAIDTNLQQATLVGSLSDPDIPISGCCGGVRKLENGGWVASWGAGPIVAEYSPEGNRLFKASWPGGLSSYRVVPATPSQLDIDALRSGMEAQHPR